MRPSHVFLASLVVAVSASGVGGRCLAAEGTKPKPARVREAKTIRDLMWVWGNPEMTKKGPHTPATFAQASPAERARLLGVPNVLMAGLGLPDDEQQAETLTKQVASSPQLVWEISPDGEGLGPPFVYRETIASIRKLTKRYPQIEGVLLDDMSTQKINRGFKPEHIRRIRELLSDTHDQVKVWGVLYTMSMNRKGIRKYINELDVINLWTWHAKDVVDLTQNVARCEQWFPGKPIVVGLYLYDYGNGRRIPLDLLERQCTTALQLAHARRIRGIVFLTITNDAKAVKWAADWIKRVGGQRIGERKAGGSVPLPKAPVEKQTFTTKLPCPSPGPTWIEGPDDTILMSFNDDGKVHITASQDEGKRWKIISTIYKQGARLSGGYFTRLADGALLLVITTADGQKRVCWVRSDDHGRTWTAPTPIIELGPNLHAYGPVCVMEDGRWAYCPYSQRAEEEFGALIMWSGDGGKTWGKPIVLPTPTDGNRGLTECTVVQLGPERFLAAIRADEGKGAADGFYLSRSRDGVQWTPPESLGERGRMPLFYKIAGTWALAYRQYDAPKGTQHSVVRFSRDGQTWSSPMTIESGVDAGPHLVRVKGKVIAFNARYPARSNLTRHCVAIPPLTAQTASGNACGK